MNLRYLLNNGKNNNLKFFLNSWLGYTLPRSIFRGKLEGMLRRFDRLSVDEQSYVMSRVNYYCRLDERSVTPLSDASKLLKDHKIKNRHYASPYFFDSYEYTRFFRDDLRWEYLFEDVTHVPDYPTIVKSRPVCSNNGNSVVLNLNKNRHFITLNDKIPFERKDNFAIFRGDIKGKSNRHRFISMFIDNPMCDVGDVTKHPDSPLEWRREAMPIYDHLRYKFIMALEGNDVASNLKWVMSSNSLAVMPKPTCETWFMEGQLIGGEHYVEIASDFSDLESQLAYYIEHPKEAVEISEAANRYVAQFMNPGREDLISLMVLQRYFERTGQL